MKWFKHMTDSHIDEKLAQLLALHGVEGYGLWWLLVEMVAHQTGRDDDKCSVSYPVSYWMRSTGLYHLKKLKILVESMHNLSLISATSMHNLCNISALSPKDVLTISMPNILKYRDEYSKKSRQNQESVRSKKEKEKQKEKENKIEPIEHTSPDEPDDEPILLDLVVGSRYEDRVNVPCELIMKAYNTFCPSLPKAHVMTQKRRDMIRVRYLKYIKSEPKGSIGVFDALFKKAEASDFLTGRDKKGWHGCGFDWLMNETNMVKVLEGNYDNKAVESNSDKIRSANKEAIRRFVDEPRSRF